MPYDVEAIRKKLKQTMSGRFNDPDEFKPEKAKSTNEPIKYLFYILPPLVAGDKLKSGTVKRTMDQFFIAHANHWIHDRPYPCPRIWDGSECQICQFGFDLLRDEKDEEKRRQIVRQWMPTSYYLVNIYFPDNKINPEELRGKVKYYNAPKTCFDIWAATLMRDDQGDPDDPQAYGVFFDEMSAFPFELQVLRQGRQNSYKTSKFRPTPGPIIRNADGSPNEKGLRTLLSLRHNLWDKVEAPDRDKIVRVAKMMIEGGDLEDIVTEKDVPHDGDVARDDGVVDEIGTSGQTKRKEVSAVISPPKEKTAAPDRKQAARRGRADSDRPVTAQSDDDEPLADEVSLQRESETSAEDEDEISTDEIDALLSQLENND